MKKRTVFLAAAALMCLSLTGCGSGANYSAATDSAYAGAMDMGNAKSAAYGEESFAAAEDYEADDSYDVADDQAASNSEGGAESENVASNRKLIKRVSITAETREFDKLTSFIEQRVEELGGYMESSNVNSGSNYSGYNSRNASYTARVPVAKMGELVSDVGKNANITNKNESAEDVTLNYVDNQSRKEALEVEMDRLMEILKQADDVDTIVALESRITDVRYEIQSIESKLRTYDNLVDFATVDITVREVEIYTPEPVKKQSDWERLTSGFVHSVKSVGRSILDFIIDLIIILPYLIVWGLVIFVIVLIIKKIWNGRGKRAEKRAMKKAAKAEKKAAALKAKQQKSPADAADTRTENTEAADTENNK